MTDLALGGVWLGVLAAGITGCLILHALGLASTYVRDILHVGAGIWIAGWPYWHGIVVPIAIVTMAALVTTLLPLGAHRNRLLAAIVRSVTSRDEHWIGLVQYTAAYAVFTAIGTIGNPLPAAAALLALSLGDGIGGAIGRAFGRHQFQLPGAKPKSLEGTLGVLVAATAGVWLAAQLLHQDVAAGVVLALGFVASLAEAVAPRGTDNLIVPIAVWIEAMLLT